MLKITWLQIFLVWMEDTQTRLAARKIISWDVSCPVSMTLLL